MGAADINNDKIGADHTEEPAPLKLGNAKGVDDNAAALEGQELNFTEEESKQILRKIDLRILPLAAVACGLQYVDKAGLGAASIYGIIEDLGLAGQEYSWAASIFYFGNLLGSVFAGRVLQYFHVGKTLGTAFFLWGITLLGCMGAKNFATLAAMRFLLGILESVLVPGLLFITTMWYTHEEQPSRIGLWTFMNGLLPIPFILIFWALGNVTSGPLAPWQLIFMLLGLVSCLYGIILWFFLPDSPTGVKWLTAREKAVAVERIARDQTGIKNKEFKWPQAWEAFKDIHVWLIFFAMFFAQVSGSVQTNFLGLIIKGFGYNALQTQLLTIPNYAVQTVVVLLVSFPPTYIKSCRNMKIPITVCATVVATAGVIILHVTPAEEQYQSRRLAAVIILAFATANYNVIISVIGANIGGFTKKQVTTSMTFFFYCLINIICPQTFLKSEAPKYPTGMKFVIA